MILRRQMPLLAQEHRPIWQADLAAGQSLKEASYHYLVTDHLGAPVLALNKAGETTWKANYEAFGKARINPASTAQINLRLPGQYFDAETGLHQNWNRDYAPGIGRYVQADPLGIFGGMNVYQYAYGNPLVYYDPYGLFGWSSMPPLPQGLVDFSAGFGDSLSFGVTRFIRTTANIGSINYCSSSYRMGEGAAVTMSIVFGGAHLGRNAIYQMGKKGGLRISFMRGFKRLKFDNRQWGSVRDSWSKAAGHGKRWLEANNQSLHHWLIPQRAKNIDIGIINAGFNYLPLTARFNSWMNGSTNARLFVEYMLKANIGGIYGASPTALLMNCSC